MKKTIKKEDSIHIVDHSNPSTTFISLNAIGHHIQAKFGNFKVASRT